MEQRSNTERKQGVWTRLRASLRLAGPPGSVHELRERVLIVIIILAIPAELAWIPINYYLDPSGILSLANLLVGIVLILNLFFLLHFRRVILSAFIALGLMLFLILFAGIRTGPLNYIWSLMVPPIIYFMLGTRNGTIGCGIQGVLLALVLWVYPGITDGSPLAIHLSVAFIIISAFGFAGEFVREKYEARLAEMSSIDSLTGIFNRRHIQDVARREIEKFRRYKRPLSLMIFDIDHFKQVNDRLGHQAGDEVLVEVVNTVASALRDSDYFGRWGGEEFLIIAAETSPENLELFAERLRRVVDDSGRSRGDGITVSAGGTSIVPGDDFQVALKRADNALYEAKRRGRNKVHFHWRNDD